jgi:predicted nucleotidyltransferase
MHSHWPFCKKYPIAKLKIFRSVADDTAKAVSDDDLMVTFETGDRLGT